MLYQRINTQMMYLLVSRFTFALHFSSKSSLTILTIEYRTQVNSKFRRIILRIVLDIVY